MFNGSSYPSVSIDWFPVQKSYPFFKLFTNPDKLTRFTFLYLVLEIVLNWSGIPSFFMSTNPVVGITSALWLGTFYLIAANGYVKPFVSKLSDFGVPETIAKALESDKMGTLAIAIVIYKLATPARYAVSIAGTVKAIKILLRRGMIKPVPPKDKLKEIVLKKVYEKSKQ
uniref:DUF1279 domain-containing protein n=1 Tax=Tetranychus urticae TaxID=32264 RepID=T1KWA4_TETUR